MAEIKINILKKTAGELEVEVEGAGHTLCNLLQKRILEDEDVDLAGYDVPHPLTSSATIYVRTKGKSKPEGVLLRAVERAFELNREFGKEFEKALKRT